MLRHAILTLVLVLTFSPAGSQVFRGYGSDGDLQSKRNQDKKTRVVRGYYKSGALHFVVPYKRDKIEGVVKEYYEDGVLKAEMLYENGRRDGLAKYFHANGMLMAKIEYRRDKEAGVSKFYDEKGVLTSTLSFRRKARTRAEELLAQDTTKSPAQDSTQDTSATND